MEGMFVVHGKVLVMAGRCRWAWSWRFPSHFCSQAPVSIERVCVVICTVSLAYGRGTLTLARRYMPFSGFVREKGVASYKSVSITPLP